MKAHEPGLIQDIFEKTMGVAGAAFRIPTNLVSGAMVGGYQGYRKGDDQEYEATAKGSATGQIAINTVQGQVQAAVSGLLVGGPAVMATNMALDAMGAGTGLYFFIKNGSAEEMGKRLSETVNEKVKSGEGGGKGLLKGAVFGGATSVKTAAITGYREGKGSAAGLVEGLQGAWAQLEVTRHPKGSFLRNSLRTAAGVTTGLLAAPTGAVLALLTPEKEEGKVPGLGTRLAVSAASGAVTGAAVGAVAGPVGMLVGAGIGMGLNLIGPASKKDFAKKVARDLRRAKKKSDDLGSDIANKNRDLFRSIAVGIASGASRAWNKAMDSGTGKAPKTEQ